MHPKLGISREPETCDLLYHFLLFRIAHTFIEQLPCQAMPIKKKLLIKIQQNRRFCPYISILEAPEKIIERSEIYHRSEEDIAPAVQNLHV